MPPREARSARHRAVQRELVCRNNHSKNGTIFNTCHGGTRAAVRGTQSSIVEARPTAVRASRRRTPLVPFESRSTPAPSLRARNPATAPLGRRWHPRPGRTTRHCDAANWREGASPDSPGPLRAPEAASVTSITSIPSGKSVQPASRSRVAPGGRQREGQVLRLARHPGRGAARVGDPRVRREPGRVSDRHSGPAHSPLEERAPRPCGWRNASSPLSIPDHQMLHCRQAAALSGPEPRYLAARCTGSSRFAVEASSPVGPTWISVPMAAQTPHS